MEKILDYCKSFSNIRSKHYDRTFQMYFLCYAGQMGIERHIFSMYAGEYQLYYGLCYYLKNIIDTRSGNSIGAVMLKDIEPYISVDGHYLMHYDPIELLKTISYLSKASEKIIEEAIYKAADIAEKAALLKFFLNRESIKAEILKSRKYPKKISILEFILGKIDDNKDKIKNSANPIEWMARCDIAEREIITEALKIDKGFSSLYWSYYIPKIATYDSANKFDFSGNGMRYYIGTIAALCSARANGLDAGHYANHISALFADTDNENSSIICRCSAEIMKKIIQLNKE